LMGGLTGAASGYMGARSAGLAARTGQGQQLASSTLGGAGGVTPLASPAPGAVTVAQLGSPAAALGGVAPLASPTAAATAGGVGANLAAAIKQVPATIAAKLSNPGTLADLTVRAAGMLLSGQMAGSGMDPAEAKLLNAQIADLQEMRQQNDALFQEKVAIARRVIGEADQISPEYFGFQRAREQQLAGARAKTAGLRGLDTPQRQAEARRYDLGISRNVGTAFDSGWTTGQQARLNTLTTGAGLYPSSYPSASSEYGPIMQAYGNAAARKRQTAADIGSFFGTLTGRRETEKEREDEEQRAGQTAGLFA
jgi:hypothetical protein